MLPALLTFVVLIGLDQWLKIWSLSHLHTDAYLTVIPNVLSMVLNFNKGAAWNILSEATMVLAVLRLLVGLGILGYLWKRRPSGVTFWSLVLISVGAVGNAIDGILRGQVVDMLYSHQLSWITQKMYGDAFPIFNIADTCIVGGTILLIATNMFSKKPEPQTQGPSAA